MDLVIAEASQPVFALIYIARAQGYFEQEHLNVTLKKFSSGRDSLESVIAGKSELATVSVTPVAQQTLDGIELRVITELHHSRRNTALVAHGSPETSTVSGLIGKRIGVSLNTSGEIFLNQLFEENALSMDSVTLVDIDPPDMLPSFIGSKVDAVAVWNPHLHNIERSIPRDKVSTFYSRGYVEASVLASLPEVLESKPEAIRRLLKALIRAERFLEESPEQALDIVALYLAEQSPNIIRASWDDFDVQLRLSNILLTLLDSESQWLINKNKSVNKRPDFSRVLEPQFLREVKPIVTTVNQAAP